MTARAAGANSAGDPLLVVDAVAAAYGTNPPVLSDITFDLHPGERLAVLGPNGGGKTTLFRLLLGELAPLTGRISAAGAFAYVPQTERSRLDYPVSALDVALMGTLSRLPWWHRLRRTDRAFARAALERVGLGELADTQYGDLSGGQRQRVLVARALVQDAPILLLDEPYTGVDRPSEQLLDGLLAQLAAEGRGVIAATHDLEQARAWDRVLCLNRRVIAFGAPARVLSPEVLAQTYGGDVVLLGDDARPAILPPHHH
jgi:manganese/iron transport system ATP-binding protein/manganese/zinc/iron transport system ATP- binding protein